MNLICEVIFHEGGELRLGKKSYTWANCRAQYPNGKKKKSCALAALATASCKVQSIFFYIHQNSLHLTSLSVKTITHLCSNNCTLSFLDFQAFKISEMVWAGYRGRFLHCHAISRLPLKHLWYKQDVVVSKDLFGVWEVYSDSLITEEPVHSCPASPVDPQGSLCGFGILSMNCSLEAA